MAPAPNTTKCTNSNDVELINWRNTVAALVSLLKTKAAIACPRIPNGIPSLCKIAANVPNIFPRQGAFFGASLNQRAAANKGLCIGKRENSINDCTNLLASPCAAKYRMAKYFPDQSGWFNKFSSAL